MRERTTTFKLHARGRGRKKKDESRGCNRRKKVFETMKFLFYYNNGWYARGKWNAHKIAGYTEQSVYIIARRPVTSEWFLYIMFSSTFSNQMSISSPTMFRRGCHLFWVAYRGSEKRLHGSFPTSSGQPCRTATETNANGVDEMALFLDFFFLSLLSFSTRAMQIVRANSHRHFFLRAAQKLDEDDSALQWRWQIYVRRCSDLLKLSRYECEWVSELLDAEKSSMTTRLQVYWTGTVTIVSIISVTI